MTDVATVGPDTADRSTGAARSSGTGRASTAGRTRITARALSRVVSAIVADALDVDADRVRVDLGDHDGRLAVTVRSPIGLPGLADVAPDRVDPGQTLIARTASTRQRVRDEVPALTGSVVSRVTLHLTGADIVHHRRVA